LAGDQRLPPESEAIPIGEHPEQIKPDSPPLEPPGFLFLFHGFTHIPQLGQPV